MENIVIGNATYLVRREFVGNKNVSELIQNKIETDCSHVLPLTTPVPASYNKNSRSAGWRRNHAQ